MTDFEVREQSDGSFDLYDCARKRVVRIDLGYDEAMGQVKRRSGTSVTLVESDGYRSDVTKDLRRAR